MAKLYFRFGAMNCGKSTHILQTAYNFNEKGYKILLMKPKTDTKGNDLIKNRSGLERKVDHLIDATDHIKSYITKDITAILIDEAQFLTEEQVKELYEISKLDNIPVLCYGLRCDFMMNPFPGAIYLLAYADDIEELKTICRCGKKATQNLRLYKGIPIFEGESILIDGESNDYTYESVCGKCYLELKQEAKKQNILIRERLIK